MPYEIPAEANNNVRVPLLYLLYTIINLATYAQIVWFCSLNLQGAFQPKLNCIHVFMLLHLTSQMMK